MIREKISEKTTNRPRISPLNPLLKGATNLIKKYVEIYPRSIVMISAGNPAGKTQSIQKIPHMIIVLLDTFLRSLVIPACFDGSQ